MFIKMTQAQADHLAGEYGDCRIEPVPYAGAFIVNANVLNEPAFSAVHELLSGLPQVEVEFTE